MTEQELATKWQEIRERVEREKAMLLPRTVDPWGTPIREASDEEFDEMRRKADRYRAGAEQHPSAYPPTRWAAVSDRMPKSGVPVLAHYRNALGNSRIVRASYAEPFTLVATGDEPDDFVVYSEAEDEYYCPEGWYEDNENEETHWKIAEEVTHWMPLPAPPD